MNRSDIELALHSTYTRGDHAVTVAIVCVLIVLGYFGQ